MRFGKYRFFIILLSVSVFLVAGFVFSFRIRNGSVSSLCNIPHYGRYFPSVEEQGFQYNYNPLSCSLSLKGRIKPVSFDKLCQYFNLEVIRYTTNFPHSVLEEMELSAFIPKGNSVWCGFGKISPDSRISVRVFMENQNISETNQLENVYMFIR